MTTQTSALPPATAALASALHDEVRRASIVLWLDRHDHFSAAADTLAAHELPFRVVPWRGSHLEVLLALEEDTRSRQKPRVVVHLPGFDEREVKRTPLLELYKAGHRFRISLERVAEAAAVSRVPREALEEFLASRPGSLSAVDAWLDQQLSAGPDIKSVLADLPLAHLAVDLLTGGALATQRPRELWEVVRRLVGLDERDWLEVVVGLRQDEVPAPDEVGFALGSWAMCVEFVHDLAPEARSALEPPLAEPARLPAVLVDECRAVCVALRQHAPERYASLTRQVEDIARPAVDATPADQLGTVDTFALEADKVLAGAAEALLRGQSSEVAALAARRLGPDGGFWLDRQPEQRRAWELVDRLAALGRAIEACGEPGRSRSLDDAASAYAHRAAPVDRAHREVEQLAERLLPHLHELPPRLVDALQKLRLRWGRWAGAWAEHFASVCETDGWLPSPELRQREIFDREVAPRLAQGQTVAYFLVDALRYEMAEVVADAIRGDATRATTVRVEPRLAELPTDTSVGMNALTPVVRSGRLQPIVKPRGIQGFRVGSASVRGWPERVRATGDRVGAVAKLELSELLVADASALSRRVRNANLVLVWSKEIDHSGEHAAGPHVFPTALDALVAGWRRLREAGVKTFVVTADHGFLLLPYPRKVAYERRIDVQRRFRLRPEPLAQPGFQAVRLSELGYDGPDCEQSLHLPRGIEVLDRGKRFEGFVHGGNAPQERVIPLLVVEHRTSAGRGLPVYRLEVEGRQVSDGYVVEGRAVPQNLALGFADRARLTLVVEADGHLVELDAVTGATCQGPRFEVTPAEPFSVRVRLEGPSPDGVSLAVAHRASEATVEAVLLDVPYRFGRPSASPDLSTVPAALLPAFEHLVAHRALREDDLQRLLVKGHLTRRFARVVEPWAAECGLTLTIKSANGIKCYEIRP